MIRKPRVLGAATEESLVKEMKELGVVFSRNEPGAGIVGASGLLLGLGKYYGMESVCLMGETSGYFVDPKSAQAVLEILAKILDVKVNYEELEAKAKQIDSITARLKEIEAKVDQEEDLGYIG
jgi:proteasome assembly chaperone (PAC2) family protein